MLLSLFRAAVAATLLGCTPSAQAASLHRRDAVPAGYVAQPYYPSPYGGWTSDWADSYAKAWKLVSNMTLAEKTNITAGTGLFMGMYGLSREGVPAS